MLICCVKAALVAQPPAAMLLGWCRVGVQRSLACGHLRVLGNR
jgi:hypothetical protein